MKCVKLGQIEGGYCYNKLTIKDKLHSDGEKRFRVVGETKKGRLLFVAFTIRKGNIRIVSARDINKKEVYLYIS